MFNDADDFFFDMDTVSSPIAADYPSDTSTVELSTNSFFDDVVTTLFDEQERKIPVSSTSCHTQSLQRAISAPEFQYSDNYNVYTTLDIKPMCQVKPVPRRQKSVVFQPFSSFDATELTVKALKEHCNTSSRNSIHSW